MPGRWLLGDAAQRTSGGDGNGERPRALLLGVQTPSGGADEVSLAELERLADTDGLQVVGELTQAREHPDPATFLGAGKVQQLAALVRERGADVVIADGELSPGQLRNLEEATGVRVADRTALILDIFGEHARSNEGKAQVELAQLAYQLPRLRGQGREMSRVGGGRVAGGAGMGVRGPGEMRLETERRRLRRRMANLREQVRDMAQRREMTRRRRARNRVPAVALTGYTNAGKSSLLNRLAGADVLVEDALFATLDPTVRRVTAPDGTVYTLTDTVGFVRHLPHQLVDAFRSTLEEVARADLVVHVVDSCAPDALGQVTAVRGVLYEIGAAQLPELLVLNKVDCADPSALAALRRAHPGALAVSAKTGEGLDALREAIASKLARLGDGDLAGATGAGAEWAAGSEDGSGAESARGTPTV
jgi:GTP-binding protein HflX